MVLVLAEVVLRLHEVRAEVLGALILQDPCEGLV